MTVSLQMGNADVQNTHREKPHDHWASWWPCQHQPRNPKKQVLLHSNPDEALLLDFWTLKPHNKPLSSQLLVAMAALENQYTWERILLNCERAWCSDGTRCHVSDGGCTDYPTLCDSVLSHDQKLRNPQSRKQIHGVPQAVWRRQRAALLADGNISLPATSVSWTALWMH